MNLICPHCNSRLELSALAEDAEARALFGLLRECGPATAPLIAYLGLFKPRAQALRWTRARRLAEEVLSLAQGRSAGLDELADACLRTLAALDERRKGSDWQPLGNHRYLARVLDAVLAESVAVTMDRSRPGSRPGPASKRADALRLLDED